MLVHTLGNFFQQRDCEYGHKGFWNVILRQDADAIRECFHPNAWGV